MQAVKTTGFTYKNDENVDEWKKKKKKMSFGTSI